MSRSPQPAPLLRSPPIGVEAAGGNPAAILAANLAALERTSPDAARRIRAAAPRADLQFIATDDTAGSGPVLSAQLGSGTAARALASRRRPLAEAARLAQAADLKDAGCIVVTGFGIGHHLAALADRMQKAGVILCFEPDVALLRAVLERIDHSAWMARCNFALLTDRDDPAAIGQSVHGLEAIVGLGVTILSPPGLAGRDRLGAAATTFETNVRQVIESVSTTVVTTMANMDVTIRNLTQNLSYYTTCPTIADLSGAGRGRTAIVVAAGPSLRRNIDLLADPETRARFIVIAVQTVLRPLLARGIRPDFVTALDYHEISRRFYEGLTAQDVEGVTLVVEPKANPAILDAFPGQIRCVADSFLDELLGPALARATPDGRAGIAPGATVAHLAYYLARHLGCDPVVLVGQDLGFTDGQYYAAGAAIHETWAGELNPFNTLEMMEWQRIVRMRPQLRRATDTLGRPIYSDVQMNTYLAQFERDFKRDDQRGLTIIDATEGGVAKRHTEARSLASVISQTPRPAAPWRAPGGTSAADADATLRSLVQRLRDVRQGVWRVGDLSRKTVALLREMLAHHHDQSRVNALIAKVNALRDQVHAVGAGYALVHRLNQTGTFRRFRADRSIHLESDLSELERQRRQIERDIDNVSWLADAADTLGEILDESVAVLPRSAGGRDAPKRTRDPAPQATAEGSAPGAASAAAAALRVAAVIPVHIGFSHIGLPRDLGATFLLGSNPLRLTLQRLARCRGLAGAILLTDDPDATARLIGPAIPGLRTSIVRADLAPLRQRQRSLRAARAWADSCWRGGIGGATIFDEVFDPALAAQVLSGTDLGTLDGVLALGCDWCLVDPALCDALIDRYREQPAVHRLTFTQAPPGLAGCVVARQLVELMAAGNGSAGMTLAYNPATPVHDPIAAPVCVAINPAVRDSLIRFIPDSPARRGMLAAALNPLGDDLLSASAETIAHLVNERAAATTAAEMPQQLILELCTGRRTSGRRGHWERGSIGAVERPCMTLSLAERILSQLGGATDEGGGGRPDSAVTLGGAGDPLLHPDVLPIIHAARRAGVGSLHVRTDLLCERELLDGLLAAAPDVISVDLMADNAETYRAIMGIDRFEQARDNLEYLLAARRAAPPGSTPWIVPRLTRCDGAYNDIEPFFDRWLGEHGAGAAVIDPLPLTIPRDRIAPLPRPSSVRRRDLRRRMTIYCDGSVPIGEKNLHGAAGGGGIIGNAGKSSLRTLWRDLTQARRDLERQSKGEHPDLQMGY